MNRCRLDEIEYEKNEECFMGFLVIWYICIN